MHTFNLTPKDVELIDEAKKKITSLYEEDKHHVGAAIRMKTGEMISAVHIEAYIGRVTVCAESIAIGSALSNGYKDFDTIVAVRHPYSDEEDRRLRVVSPCGILFTGVNEELRGERDAMEMRNLVTDYTGTFFDHYILQKPVHVESLSYDGVDLIKKTSRKG
ncbi:cytidine deaminase [Bacillus safensis]|uniref:cytidine deaminase n=1 Tax=Bacillus safensis TaxID=561879 RepID=UPI0018CFDCB8|nr:cytidine deaminase [Bacillus safensis]